MNKYLIALVAIVALTVAPAFAQSSSPLASQIAGLAASPNDTAETTCFKMDLVSDTLGKLHLPVFDETNTVAANELTELINTRKCQDTNLFPLIKARVNVLTAYNNHRFGRSWRTDAEDAKQNYELCITANYGARRSAECSAEMSRFIRETIEWDE